MGHHAGLNLADFGGVASGGAAGLIGDSEIAGVHEADVVLIFLEPSGVGADGVGGGLVVEDAWMGMGLVFCGGVFVCVGFGGGPDVGVAAVTVGASEADGIRCVHGRGVGLGVAGQAAGGFLIGLGLRLEEECVLGCACAWKKR